MEIYKKLASCKNEIKNTKLEKKGENKFSNYKYFTPDQVEQLVSTACENNSLLTTFDLKRNEFGVVGYLTIIDIETGDKISFEMATAIPEIKATNIAQQLGGCVTYTERYLKMSAFGISDNSLDFDTTENTKKQAENKAINFDLENATEKKLKDCKDIEELKSTYTSLSKDLQIKFKNLVNTLKIELS